MDRMRISVIIIIYPLLCFFCFFLPVSAVLPYTPSHIFVSPRHNNSLAYILLSDSFSRNKTVFLSLDISGTVDAANPSYSVLLEDAPFHGDGDGDGGESTAFVPVIDRHGIIKVYAGNCQDFSNHGLVWQFDPDDTSIRSIGNGTWDKYAVKQVQNHDRLPSANHLASGFAYASTNRIPTSVYTFGGVCPFRTGSDHYGDGGGGDGGNWISSAYYSKSMATSLHPEFSSDNTNNTSSYRLQSSATTTTTTTTVGDLVVASPVPLAGSSITPLQPSYTTTLTTGDVRIEQSFLFIGGHSLDGPANLSRVALFSLPQNSWNFVDIKTATNTSSSTESSSDSGLSDLDVRDGNATSNAAMIGPRSGHSAVLSPDGSKVIVFGGWVGNTSTPAEPLLAVLEIGKGYGGSGSWAWKYLPSMDKKNNSSTVSGPLTTNKSGIFGHGATMLPGGMMMIAGGYTIPPRNSSNKRSTTSSPELNPQVFLYNVTSNSWSTSYTNPSRQPSRASKKTNSGPLSSTSKKVGLGVGIGVGLPVVAGTIALFVWSYARRRRTRRARDQTIRNLALGAARFHFWNEPNMSSSFRIKPSSTWSSAPGRHAAYPWACNQGNVDDLGWWDTASSGLVTAERPNLLRRTGSGGQSLDRQYYRDFDNNNNNNNNNNSSSSRNTPGHIHTIDEREEEEANVTDSLIVKTQPEPVGQEDSEQHISAVLLPEGRDSIGLDLPQHLPEDTTNFMSRASLQIGERNDRTTSNLSSDSSTTASAIHHSSPGQLTPPSTGNTEATSDNGMTPAEKHNSADSFTTALTGQSIQQAESENLLGGGEGRQSWQWQTSFNPPSKLRKTTTIGDGGGSMKGKDYGFIFGTVRRALTGVRKGAGTMPGKRYPSAIPTVSDFNGGSTTTAVERSSFHGSTLLPRRTVSASAELCKRKQETKGWGFLGTNTSTINNNNKNNGEAPEVLFSRTRIPKSIPRQTRLIDHYERQASSSNYDAGNGHGKEREDGHANGYYGEDEEEDRDIEAAAEGRRVQVTYTVPKEKLRVVNATAGDMDGGVDTDGEGLSSSSSSYYGDGEEEEELSSPKKTATATATAITINGCSRRSVSK